MRNTRQLLLLFVLVAIQVNASIVVKVDDGSSTVALKIYDGAFTTNGADIIYLMKFILLFFF